MDENVFKCDNNFASQTCEKLYLDTKTADISFIFEADTDHPERIVAHKILLSAGSPVFDTMFYGSLVEMGDVPIVDASPGAFKEFLQFFYKSQVQLTSCNIGEVINLCKKYELSDGVKVCEIPLQKSLTNNDMCWGYEVAVLLELDELQKFCEQKIKYNAEEILTSESFLECSRNSLDKILEIVQSNCRAMVMVEACMEWAKVENQQNDLDISPGNLRIQLDEFFNRIPYSEMNMEQFFHYASKFRGFFTDVEMKEIIEIIATNKFQHDIRRFANMPSCLSLECDRNGPGDVTVFNFSNSFCSFESNKPIFLKEFYLPRLHANSNTENVQNVDVIYSFNGPHNLIHTNMIVFGKSTMSTEGETLVILPKPVFIEVNEAYYIGIAAADFSIWKEISFFQQSPLENDVKLSDGTELKFFPSNKLVSRLIFQTAINGCF